MKKKWDIEGITYENYSERIKGLPVGLKVAVLQKLIMQRSLELECKELEAKAENIKCLLNTNGNQ